MPGNSFQETRFEMPVRVANGCVGRLERERETGREAKRRWKTWFLCELATIVLHGRPAESAVRVRPLSHFQFQPRITSAWMFISKISTFKDSKIGRFIS